MALINRISRLFAADFHAVLDNLEEPKTLLKLSIREMEECNQASENDLRILTDEIAGLEYQLENLHSRIEALDADLDLCFESENEKLARSHIRRKLESQRLEEHLQRKLKKKQEHHYTLKQKIDLNDQTLVNLQQKAALFSDHPQQHNNIEIGDLKISDLCITTDDVEIALLLERKKRLQS